MFLKPEKEVTTLCVVWVVRGIWQDIESKVRKGDHGREVIWCHLNAAGGYAESGIFSYSLK